VFNSITAQAQPRSTTTVVFFSEFVKKNSSSRSNLTARNRINLH
jgi:hypothetical protein